MMTETAISLSIRGHFRILKSGHFNFLLTTEAGQRDLTQGIGFFRPSGARPLTGELVTFIDQYREDLGIEPIGKQLPVAPSTYYEYKARAADPGRLPARAQRDRALCREIRRVWEDNFQVYDTRKVWHQLQREGQACGPLYGGTAEYEQMYYDDENNRSCKAA